MGNHAAGPFTVDSWDESVYDQRPGAKLARVAITKTFHGDIAGTSTADLLTAIAADGSAAYVAVERIVANVHGRSGTFVVHHRASARDGEQELSILVLPGSGTGELSGITGAMAVAVAEDGSHSYTFDYELSAP